MAIIISVVSAFLITPYFLTISDTLSSTSKEYNDLTKPPQPRNFTESIDFNTIVEGGIFTPGTDVEVVLNITYPLGTLVVDENVSIFGTAYMHITARSANMTSCFVGFQNGLLSPLTYTNGVPLVGYFNFTNLGEGFAIETSNMTLLWPIDGDYKPIIQLNYDDGSTQQVIPDYLVFHVYPIEQLTQIETNKISLETNMASLKLSQAVLILGAIAVVALVVQILDHTDTECNYPKGTGNGNYTCPYIEDKRRNRFKVIKEKGKTQSVQSEPNT